MIFDGAITWSPHKPPIYGRGGPYLSPPPPPSDALLEMLIAPTLALLTIVFNFCALLRVTDHQNGLSKSKWYTIEERDGTTFKVYVDYSDDVASPPTTPSPAYPPALSRAERAYRSFVAKMLDLVVGSKVQTASAVAPSSSLSQSDPSLTKPTDPIASIGLLPPSLTSLADQATSGTFPTHDPSILSAATSPVARSPRLIGLFSCLVYTAIFTWLKVSRTRLSQLFPSSLNTLQNRHSCRPIRAPKPILTCDANCRPPAKEFHPANKVASIPSSGANVMESGSCGAPGSSTTPRTFPVVVTNSDGQALFNTEIMLSSEHVATMLSTTTSTVSLSLEVVASSDTPTGARPFGMIHLPPTDLLPSARVVHAIKRRL